MKLGHPGRNLAVIVVWVGGVGSEIVQGDSEVGYGGGVTNQSIGAAGIRRVGAIDLIGFEGWAVVRGFEDQAAVDLGKFGNHAGLRETRGSIEGVQDNRIVGVYVTQPRCHVLG